MKRLIAYLAIILCAIGARAQLLPTILAQWNFQNYASSNAQISRVTIQGLAPFPKINGVYAVPAPLIFYPQITPSLTNGYVVTNVQAATLLQVTMSGPGLSTPLIVTNYFPLQLTNNVGTIQAANYDVSAVETFNNVLIGVYFNGTNFVSATGVQVAGSGPVTTQTNGNAVTVGINTAGLSNTFNGTWDNALALGADGTGQTSIAPLLNGAFCQTHPIYFPPFQTNGQQAYYNVSGTIITNAVLWTGSWAGTPNQTGGALLNYGASPGTVFIPGNNTNVPILTIGNDSTSFSNLFIGHIWFNGWGSQNGGPATSGTNMATMGVLMSGGSHQSKIYGCVFSGSRTNFVYGGGGVLDHSCDQNALEDCYLIGGGLQTNTVNIFEQGWNGTGPNGHTFTTELELINDHIQVSASAWNNGCWAIYDDSVDNKWVGSKIDGGAGSGVAANGKLSTGIFLTNSISGATPPYQNGDNVSEWDFNQGSYATNIMCVLGYANKGVTFVSWVFGIHVYGGFLYSDGTTSYGNGGSLRFHSQLNYPEATEYNLLDSSINFGIMDDLVFLTRSSGQLTLQSTNGFRFKDFTTGSNVLNITSPGVASFSGGINLNSNVVAGGYVLGQSGLKVTNTAYISDTDTNGTFVGFWSIHNDNQGWLLGTTNGQLNFQSFSSLRLLAGGKTAINIKSNTLVQTYSDFDVGGNEFASNNLTVYGALTTMGTATAGSFSGNGAALTGLNTFNSSAFLGISNVYYTLATPLTNIPNANIVTNLTVGGTVVATNGIYSQSNSFVSLTNFSSYAQVTNVLQASNLVITNFSQITNAATGAGLGSNTFRWNGNIYTAVRQDGGMYYSGLTNGVFAWRSQDEFWLWPTNIQTSTSASTYFVAVSNLNLLNSTSVSASMASDFLTGICYTNTSSFYQGTPSGFWTLSSGTATAGHSGTGGANSAGITSFGQIGGGTTIGFNVVGPGAPTNFSWHIGTVHVQFQNQ